MMFAAISNVMKNEMGASVERVIYYMLQSLQSVEGFTVSDSVDSCCHANTIFLKLQSLQSVEGFTVSDSVDSCCHANTIC